VPSCWKSVGSAPGDCRYGPGGLVGGNEPAGETWSVVTESPTMTRTRAFSMSATFLGSPRSWKNGGSCTYVDFASHAYIAPVGEGIVFQMSSPSKIFPYSVVYISVVMAVAMTSLTCSCVGQMSLRNTGLPSLPFPIGWSARSIFTVPASAYATTSGGDAR